MGWCGVLGVTLYAVTYHINVPLLLLLSARGCPWAGADEQTVYTAINAKVLKLFENFGTIQIYPQYICTAVTIQQHCKKICI